MRFVGGDALKASTSKKTHGLGLYICKKYVEARGGRMELLNLSDGGARVTARWPAEAVEARFD